MAEGLFKRTCISVVRYTTETKVEVQSEGRSSV